jgi:hypothetical protein
MTGEDRDIREADELYERYARPLERDHMGEYVVVTRDGRVLVGREVHQLAREALSHLGKGHFIFKIGERALGKWR